jgi:hypothetical protein
MIVNLNQYRKKRRRAEAKARANENRIRFGRSKGQRDKEARKTSALVGSSTTSVLIRRVPA